MSLTKVTTNMVSPTAASLAGTETLTNKTLTSPVINSPTGILKVDVGLGNVDNTSDATKNSAVATLTNKTLTSPVINSPTGLVKSDVGLGSVDNTSDATKNSAVATLTNKTLTSPVINSPTGITKSDIGLSNVDNTSDATKNSAAVTLTNKTLTTPIISSIINTGTLTLPTSTDTLVGRATTDALTNKDIDGGTASNTNRITLPKNTLVNLTSLTRKAGTLVYDTSSGTLYYDNGSTLVQLATGAGAAKVSFSANTSTTAGSTSTPLVYTVEDHDSDSAFSTSTGLFTVPVGKGGVYEFGATYYFGATTTYASIYVNGVEKFQGINTIGSASVGSVFGLITLVAGDVVGIRPGASATAVTGAKVNNFWGLQVS